MQPREINIDGFLFSTDKSKLNVTYIHSFLSNKSYWAQSIPLHVVEKSINNSLAFGIYDQVKQIGFAKLTTDYATFAYLGDVFIDESFRGRGLSKKLMDFIFNNDEMRGLRRIILATRDAHGLYSQFGFKSLNAPEKFMEVHRPDVYKDIKQFI